MRSQAVLPSPAPDALAASQALAARIAGRIRERGGWIGLDEYMAMALYEPQLGYYAGGSRKFGAAGDFVTAPELSPLFGVCLAQQCAQWFEACSHRVIEFGAGSGALAVQVLGELERLGFADTEYLIVEVSGELAERQRERIAREQPQALARVRWLSDWPAQIDGVVLANELLDAMPVRGFAVLADDHPPRVRVMERGVALREQPDAIGFDWALREAPADFAQRVLDRLGQGFEGPVGKGVGAQAGDRVPASAGDHLPATAGEGVCLYAGEIGEQAELWVAQAASRLSRGAMLLIDYGFPRREHFHPQRAMGTLMCHYRHHAHGDPFRWPGLQDITAHVDFSAIAASALAAGLEPLGFVSQSRLLTNLGLLDRLRPPDRAGRGGPDDRSDPDRAAQTLAWARQAQSLQVLLSEAEMGELFKALAVGRGVGERALGFARGDRMASLLTP